jgi:hypothetical protein
MTNAASSVIPLETADIVVPPPYRPLYQIPIG